MLIAQPNATLPYATLAKGPKLSLDDQQAQASEVLTTRHGKFARLLRVPVFHLRRCRRLERRFGHAGVARLRIRRDLGEAPNRRRRIMLASYATGQTFVVDAGQTAH
jgi:hypothetical protein